MSYCLVSCVLSPLQSGLVGHGTGREGTGNGTLELKLRLIKEKDNVLFMHHSALFP